MKPDEKIIALRHVDLFSGLDEATLVEVAGLSQVRHYAPDQRIVYELEFGTDVYVIARGQADVSVCSQTGTRELLGEVGPGAIIGEMASLTGELRSATVRALTPVDVLVLPDQVFDRLGICHPEIAMSLARTMVDRLADDERSLEALLSSSGAAPSLDVATTHRSTVTVLWRELVVNREKDLPFLALVAFVLTLFAVRLVVFLAFTYDLAPREVLRAAYVSGFALVILCTCAALLTFRPEWRRAIAVAFGIGVALIVNELGVTLAFDIFYKDILTPDPALTFDVERLYRRTESARATVVVVTLLIQAIYLRSFYLRLWQLLKVRWLRLLRGR